MIPEDFPYTVTAGKEGCGSLKWSPGYSSVPIVAISHVSFCWVRSPCRGQSPVGTEWHLRYANKSTIRQRQQVRKRAPLASQPGEILTHLPATDSSLPPSFSLPIALSGAHLPAQCRVHLPKPWIWSSSEGTLPFSVRLHGPMPWTRLCSANNNRQWSESESSAEPANAWGGASSAWCLR